MLSYTNKPLQGVTFIDLFAGVGGFRLALESLGAKCVFSSEFDKKAVETYERNFGEKPYGDITQIQASAIPDFDILCGGFPCQPFSICGKLKGFEDTRGTLFFDIMRIAREKKPKILFLENVPNLQRHDGGKTFQVITNTLQEAGYTPYYKIIKATDAGLPNNRKRLYIVAYRNPAPEFKFFDPIPLTTHVEDYLLPQVDEKYIKQPLSVTWTREDNSYSDKPIRLAIYNKGSQGERIYSIKGSCVTFTASGSGMNNGYWVNEQIRRLAPRECFRLMGFPDWYKIHENERAAMKQIGNSVVINVLQKIAENFIL